MLFDTFATTVWKPSCVKLRGCTKVGYESVLNCHILPQWSGRDMDAISVADIESWLNSFDKPGAARKAYAVFRSILRLAFKRGLTDNDVTIVRRYILCLQQTARRDTSTSRHTQPRITRNTFNP